MAPRTIIAACCVLALVVSVGGDYKQEVKAAVDKLSGTCRLHAEVGAVALTSWPQAVGCSRLTQSDKFKSAVMAAGCTEVEYNKIEDVVCAASPTPDSESVEYEQDLKAAVDKLSGTCKSYTSDVFGKLSQWSQPFGCRSLRFSDDMKTVMLRNGCTEAEYTMIKDVVCATSQTPDSECVEYEQDVKAAVDKLSGTCKYYAAGAFGALTLLSQADGCSLLTQYDPLKAAALLSGCTEAEYISVQDAFCGVNVVIDLPG